MQSRKELFLGHAFKKKIFTTIYDGWYISSIPARNMPSKPYILIFSLLVTSLFGDDLIVHDDLGEFLGASLFADAFRFEQIDGADIVNFTRYPTVTPFFFPKVLSLHECMDRPSFPFYSLKELVRNPSLVKIKAKEKKTWVVNNTSKIEMSHAYARDSKVFDASQLLIPSRHQSLASDEQLEKFLYIKKRNLPDEETQKQIIENLLKDEYADKSVAGFLGHAVRERLDSPIVKSSVLNQRTQGSLETQIPPQATYGYKDVAEEAVVKSVPFIPQSIDQEKVPPVPDRTKLNLVAHKPLRDGTLKPAQASEIYLTTQDLKELLKDMTEDPAIAGEVRSVAELWAKAEKNVSRNPEIALGVKSILLSAKVGRARTDPYGQASLENLSPDDKYFVIGIDKDIETNVVTIWSKEVEVEPGENLVELTSTDVIYQE